MSEVRAAAAWLALLLAVAAAEAPRAWAARAELVVDGFTEPVFVATPPGDTRAFVVERAGRIRIVAGGAIVEPPLLDIRDRVDTEREGGLVGLAFADDWATTGRFYVYYTHGVPGVDDRMMDARISAFQASGSPPTASAAAEQVLWSLPLPNTIHHGGTIALHAGALYLALGDGGGATSEDGAYDPDDTAQNDAVPFGKLLRFTPSDPPPWTPQLVAKGFRNPFRFSFDAPTGDLYIGDVGQDTREEVDVLPDGFTPAAACPALPNYGWDVLEGTVCWGPDAPGEPACDDPCLIPPIYEYPHEPVVSCRGAVTGGVVYRGAALPTWQGRYLFADYCDGHLFSLRWTPANGTQEFEDDTAELLPGGQPVGRITGFGTDAQAEVYVTAVADETPAGGRLYRIPEPGRSALLGVALVALGAVRATRRSSVRT